MPDDFVKLDSDLTLSAGLSESGIPIVRVVGEHDGVAWEICEMIPEWMVRHMNYANRRRKNPAYRGTGGNGA